MRLLVAVLLRAGAIQMTHKAQIIESTTSIAARDALTNNNHFRAASFQPKKGVDFVEIAKAAEHFKSTFGAAVKELALSPVVAEIRAALARSQDDLQTARDQLVCMGYRERRYSRMRLRRRRQSSAAPRIRLSPNSTRRTRRSRKGSGERQRSTER